MRGNVEDVRRKIARFRAALIAPSPRQIEDALPELNHAIATMQETERRLAAGDRADREMAAALTGLVEEIRVTQALADRGLELYRNRARELAMLTGGYGATGMPAPLPTGATIRIEG